MIKIRRRQRATRERQQVSELHTLSCPWEGRARNGVSGTSSQSSAETWPAAHCVKGSQYISCFSPRHLPAFFFSRSAFLSTLSRSLGHQNNGYNERHCPGSGFCHQSFLSIPIRLASPYGRPFSCKSVRMNRRAFPADCAALWPTRLRPAEGSPVVTANGPPFPRDARGVWGRCFGRFRACLAHRSAGG